MRLDQQIREAQILQDQLRWLQEIKPLQDQMPWLREAQILRDQMPWLREVQILRDQLRWLQEIKPLQDQMPWLREAQILRDQMPWLREAQILRDRLPQVNTVLDQMTRINTVLDKLPKFDTVLDQMALVNTFKDRWLQEFNTLQDVEDRIFRLTNFSHNLSPFVEQYAEDLLKEEAVSNQKMTDEVKKQVEDLFKELENEEIADEVEFLERSWYKVEAWWGKKPNWSKNCLVIIWYIFQICLSAYLSVLFQNSYQAANPTTTVYKPVIKIIKKAERQGLHLPSEYRIVTASKLNVRERPTRHSDIRGTLFAGDLVVIKKKKKNWSLVEYSNEETRVKTQGWVFTRYLRKIN